jgi:hypothetical protein
MTRNELVAAYQTGRIDRRAFIKGMTALGLSLTFATSMADQVRASSGNKHAQLVRNAGDIYEEPDDIYKPPPAETESVTTLPATGLGGTTSGSTNWAPLALLGGAAALVASRFRRLRGGDAE